MVVQTGYKATFLGQEVIFADEAQYWKVKNAYEQKIGKGGGGFSESSDEGGMGGNFLGTMGQGLNTVAAFLNGRNLQGKIEDIDDALDTMKATRGQIAALPAGATVGDLVPLLVKYLDAERDAFARSAGNEIGTLFDAACAAAAWRPRARDSNKGSHGSVLVYGGGAGMRGAALLAARGAQALGAGKVLVGTPDGELFDPGQPQLMTGAANPDFASFDAVVIGCGLGRCAPARERVAAALAGAPALVLDADALNLLAADPTLADARFTGAPAPQRRVMTPHPLEAARLLGCDAAQVQADRRGAALALARRYRMVALLKGAGSVVATPEGNWSIVDAGGPALASAGTGDVLAGMIGALLARGQSPEQAVCAAAWLHGRAGSRFEIAHGHAEGLSAAELPQLVRDALHELIESSRTPQ